MTNEKPQHFWITIDSDSLLFYFEKVKAGHSPDEIMIELYLNGSHDEIDS